MVSSKEHLVIERMVRIIHDEGKIKYFDLIDRSRISISRYNQLKGYMLDKYDNQLRYDKISKEFVSFNSVGRELEKQTQLEQEEKK